MMHLRFFAAALGHRTFRFPLITPPMGLLYLGALMREKFGADVRIVNQRLHNLSNDALVRQIISYDPHILALSAFTTDKAYLKDITEKIKTALPKTLIIVGGAHPTAVRSQVLEETKADIAVISEGEMALELIIHQYFSDRDWSTIPGIIWRHGDGALVENPGNLPPIMDLDSLPFPAYDLADLPSYWRKQSMPPVSYRKYATLISSRGCPYGCKWCQKLLGETYRTHSAERIVEEIIYHQKTFGITDFEFQDEIFNLDHKRLIEFCELIHKKNLKIKLAFPSGLRTDILKESEIDALVSAGAYFSAFALETGSPRLQKAMGKYLNIPKFLHNVEYAVNKGIFSTGFVMLGFPTETAAEMEETIRVTCASQLHTASFFIVMPLPNTEVYDMAMEVCPDKVLQYDSMDDAYTYSRLNISAEPDEVLWHYQTLANRRFYTAKRIYRIVRDTPAPLQLALYVPHFIDRILKGKLIPIKK